MSEEQKSEVIDQVEGVDETPETPELDTPDQGDADTAAASDDDEVVQLKKSELESKFKERADRATRNAEAKAKREYEAKLQELQAQIPQPQKPSIPPMPDPYEHTDDEYKRLMAQRDAAIREAVAFEARQKAQEEFKQSQIRQRQQAEFDSYSKSVNEFERKAKESNIDPIKAVQSISELYGAQVTKEIFDIAKDMDDGQHVLDYLSKNHDEIDLMIDKPIHVRALHLATKVLPKVGAAKKQTKAPAPATILKGKSGNLNKYPLSSGGTFS